MARTQLGLYKAEVMNTANFNDTGKIQVRVLGINVEDTWVEAPVLTPFGGNPNMGIKSLPPIGSFGYVMYERGQNTAPIWVGSLMRFWGKEFENGYGNPVEGKDSTDFIVKTQYTKIDDRELDTKNNRIENILKMNETEFSLIKVRQDSDAYEYKTEAYDLEEEPYHLLKLTDEEIKLKFKFNDNSKSNTISLKEDKVELSFDTDAGTMKASINEDSIELTAGGSHLILRKDGDIEIMSSAKIKLNGEGKSAVLYEALRDFINQAFNSHTHGSPAGPTSPPMKPYTSASSMKSANVKLE